MDSESRVELLDYAYELVDNITRGDYTLEDAINVREINAVLNNNTLMDYILLGLEDHYDERREAESRFNDFVNYNRNIINNTENENIIRRVNNININNNENNENNARPPTPPTPEIAEPEPIEIPQEVIDRIPQEVLNVITCPISGEIMRNPVVNSVGQTYDKTSIQQWISRGNRNRS